MKNKTRYRKDGLVTKVWDFQPVKDKEGKTYVPFCTFKYHVGVSMFEDVCEKRKCHHYQRLYVTLPNRKP